MYCNNCGNQVTAGSLYCKYCGTKIESLNSTEQKSNPKPKTNPYKPIIIALSVLLVAVTVVSAVLVIPKLIKKNKDITQPWEYVSAGYTVAAVSNNGGVYCSDVETGYEGVETKCYYDYSEWNDVKTVSVDRMTVGLKNDGTVVVGSYSDYDYRSDNEDATTDYYDTYIDSSKLLNNIKTEVSSWTDINRVYTYEDDVFGIKNDGAVVCTSGVEYDLSDLKDVEQISCGQWRETTYITILFDDGTVKVLFNNPEEEYDDSEFGEVDINKYNDWESWSNIEYVCNSPEAGPVALNKDGKIICSDLVNLCYQDYIAKNPDDPDEAKEYVEGIVKFNNTISNWQNVIQFDIAVDDWTGELMCIAVNKDGGLYFESTQFENGIGAKASGFDTEKINNYSGALAATIYNRMGIIVLNESGTVENLCNSDEIDVSHWYNVKTSENVNTSSIISQNDATSTSKTEKTRSGNDTTAKTATAKTATNTISEAYWGVVEDYENKYGDFKNTQPYVTGLCWLELIDFDADGTQELFVAYNDNKNSDSNFKYDIWSYKSGDAVKIASRKLKTGDYDTAKTVHIYVEKATKQSYVYEVDDFEYESVEGSLYTKSGNEFTESYSLIMAESMYRLDRDWYDDDEFSEEFKMYTIDIGSEETETYIADAKRIISRMD